MPVSGSQMLQSWVLGGTVSAYNHTLRGFQNCRLSEQVMQMLNAGGGELDASIRYTVGIVPICTVTTMDDKTILDALWANSNVVPHIPIAGGTGLQIYFQDLSQGGTRNATGTLYTITKGIIVPKRVSGGKRRYATVELEVYAIFDGTNAPIQRATGQALAVSDPGCTTAWKCAAVVDNVTTINEIEDWSIDFGLALEPYQPANTIYNTGVVIAGFMPRAQFVTRDVGALLTLTAMNAANPGAAGLKFYLSEFDVAGVGVKASTALTLIFRTQSCYKPDQIENAPGGRTVSVSVVGLGTTPDGTASKSPLSYATGATNVAEQTTQVNYTPGPIKDNSTEVSYHDASLDFGIQVETRRGAAELWDTLWYVLDRKPKLRVNTDDSAYYAGLGQGGRAVSTGFHMYLRKMTENSQPVANASAVHVKLSINQGWISPNGGGGSHLATSQWGFDVDATKGAGAMLTVAVASAIT